MRPSLLDPRLTNHGRKIGGWIGLFLVLNHGSRSSDSSFRLSEPRDHVRGYDRDHVLDEILLCEASASARGRASGSRLLTTLMMMLLDHEAYQQRQDLRSSHR